MLKKIMDQMLFGAENTAQSVRIGQKTTATTGRCRSVGETSIIMSATISWAEANTQRCSWAIAKLIIKNLSSKS